MNEHFGSVKVRANLDRIDRVALLVEGESVLRRISKEEVGFV